MQNKTVRRLHKFTLIELMIVLIILSLLAALVGPPLIGRLEEAKHETAKSQISLLSNAVKDYYLDMGNYPENLRALVQDPGTEEWDGPYLDPPELPDDPWGNPYHYERDATVNGKNLAFDIYTYGADNSPGGEDENRPVHRISIQD